MLSGLMPPVPPGIGLEGIGDLAIGLGGQVGDQHLDALVLGLEADECLGLVEADQRRHADPGARREDRVGGERGRHGLAATIRATAAKYRSSFMKDLPGLHGGRSMVGRCSCLIGILSLGHDGVVPVGPLLAVLMSLQQGRVGVRSTITFRYVGHFRGISPGLRALFEAFAAAKYRVPSAAPAALARMPHRCAARSAARAMRP